MDHTVQYYTLHLAKSYRHFARCVRECKFAPGPELYDSVAVAQAALAAGNTPGETWLGLVKGFVPWSCADKKHVSLKGLHAAIAVEHARGGAR